jgi:hypothetical protein
VPVDLIAIDIPCPTCQNTVPVKLVRMGRYVRCDKCRTTFLVIDEASLPESGSVQFQPQGDGEAAVRPRFGVAQDLSELDDPTQKLATWSLFLGGLSLALICLVPLGIFTSVPGLIFGMISLKGGRRNHAIAGIIINSIAISITVLFVIAYMQQAAIRGL